MVGAEPILDCVSANARQLREANRGQVEAVEGGTDLIRRHALMIEFPGHGASLKG
jgi:hypothetical protein